MGWGQRKRSLMFLGMTAVILSVGVSFFKKFSRAVESSPHRSFLLRSPASSAEESRSGPSSNIGQDLNIQWTEASVELSVSNDFVSEKISETLLESLLSQWPSRQILSQPTIGVRIAHFESKNQLVTFEVVIGMAIEQNPLTADVNCSLELTWYLPPARIKDSVLTLVQDPTPVRRCTVSGDLGQALEIGSFVELELNRRFREMDRESLQLSIGAKVFGDPETVVRLSQMEWLSHQMDSMRLSLRQDIVLNKQALVLRLEWPALEHLQFVESLLAQLKSVPFDSETDAAKENVGYAQSVLQWEQSAPDCEWRGQLFPSKHDCETGDMNLFAGLLCSVGDENACAAVAAGQSESGQWWRSPQLKKKKDQYNEFSSDMLIGTVLYFQTKHQPEAFSKWLKFILQQRLRVSSHVVIYRSCVHDHEGTCNLLGGDWLLLNQLAQRYQTQDQVPTSVRGSYGVDYSWLPMDALLNQRGFRLHLIAARVYLAQLFEQKLAQATSPDLVAREPENPFFRYLYFGADRKTNELFRSQCPMSADAAQGQKNEWSWERAGESQAWKNSMGWDCIFLARLLARQME